jgi:hypothetical protein
MSDAGWYQRKMAQMRSGTLQRPAPQPYQQPQPQYQQPTYQQQAPVQHYQPQPQQAPPVTIENLFGAMGHWRGGKAHQLDREPCPQCGGNQFYSRSAGARRGPPPAPHCYNCGYNGLFEQGDPTTWGA